MTVARRIAVALARARIAILTIAVTYAISVIVGVLMVHTGNEFALSQRDNIVNRAVTSDQSSIALQQGEKLKAALFDFGANLFLGAVPNTIGGIGIVFAYPIAAYRGWVGGIVSVDEKHVSRFADAREGIYYVLVLILQLIPYSLSGGAGVNLGIAFLRPPPDYQGTKWIGLPREAVLDVLWIYALVVPLFLFASLVEFLFA